MDETGENGSASERRRWADVLVWPVRRLARSAIGPRRNLWLALAICGVMIKLSSSSNGLSIGIGSGSVTSIAAQAMLPFNRAV